MKKEKKKKTKFDRWYRNWFVHNTFGHTSLAVCEMLRMPALGEYFHQVTLPLGHVPEEK